MKQANKVKRRSYSGNLRARLKSEAEKLVSKVFEAGPPYDPHLVAQHLGVEVIEKPLAGFDGYVEQSEGQYIVTLAKGAPLQRQRFTLAHELCHVWLMRQADSGYPAPLVRYRNTKNLPGLHQDPVEEFMCNFFASELLIPSSELKARFEKKEVGPKTIFRLANDYCVSPQAAAIQLSTALRGRFVACSLWNLESLWPLPMWWTGIKTPFKYEMQLIEELVASRDAEMEMWPTYGRDRLKVIIEMEPRVRVTMMTIRHFKNRSPRVCSENCLS